MNPTLESILNRKSIRKYTSQAITPETIRELLTAAMSAPSACNQQPWHFVVITERNILNELSTIHSGLQMLAEAPLAILICVEPKLAQLDFFWQHDCAAATENILLAATASGLGGVWLGINPNGDEASQRIASIVNLPQSIVPFAMVSLGYPAEVKAAGDRYRPERVHSPGRW
ncbi:nitroreductase [Hydrogenispora ethanolica]|jgi:nitroreductase|uniref:Nitroreductase n=1 Tax=Hydrogenispora ethanolica TaxID=1082276 RepID=A0A4R1RIF7_HYDET|nr:nitroreductase family protein [Hydrogenispora ethanolica]TCL65885.1 nitroreductase [Hydrogenispora ethanolica]